MCFFYHTSKLAVQKKHSAKISDKAILKFSEQMNGFEFPLAPVIMDQKPDEVQLAQWGLIPSWSKSRDIQKFTLNARIETLNEKPSFKQVHQQRCLVLASGFYDWQWLDAKGKNKQKYHIQVEDQDLFSFAGLWSEWQDVQSGQNIKTYSIVTTAANELMAKIHSIKQRMPIILKPEDEQNWLQGQNYTDFLLPYSATLYANKIMSPNAQGQLFEL